MSKNNGEARTVELLAAVVAANPSGNDSQWSQMMGFEENYVGKWKSRHPDSYEKALQKAYKGLFKGLRAQAIRNAGELLNSEDERIKNDFTKFALQHLDVIEPEQIRVEQQVITVNLTDDEGDYDDNERES